MAFIAVATTAAVVGGVSQMYGANKQASAAKQAAGMQADAANRATDVQLQMFNQNREDMAPWRNTGQEALYSLADLMGIRVPINSTTGQPANEFMPYSPVATLNPAALPSTASSTDSGVTYLPQSSQFGALVQPFDYNNWKDPGYDFRLQQGINALDRSAAAHGRLFSGAQGKALTEYGQNYGSNEFTNAYNRWKTNQDTLYNRLAGLSGTGQTATNQIGQWGQNTANNIGNNMVTAGNAMGQGYNNAASAMASGYTGMSNQLMGGLGTYLNYNQNQQLMNMYGQNAYRPQPYGNQFSNGFSTSLDAFPRG